MGSLDRHTKQRGRYLGNRPALIAGVTFRRHGGGRADALNVRRAAGIAEPPHQEGHIRTLPATVGMQFVQHQKLEAGSCLDQGPFPRPGEDKFEHHIVGQQNVRRIRDDSCPVPRRFLPGVTVERHRRAVRVTDRQELPQLPELTVGQGVHRIDDDRLDPWPVCPRRLGRQDAVDDRDDVREALTRTRARRQHIAAAGARRLDGLALVPVQPQHWATGVAVLEAEDSLALGLEQPCFY
jgi:hypothetical protein